MNRITIIGPGRVGGALAIALSRKGYVVDGLVFRSEPPGKWTELIVPPPMIRSFDRMRSIESDIVLFTTGDSDIGQAAGSIADRIKKGSVALHTSGALSSAELLPLERSGAFVGSMHPLLSISDPVRGADTFAGAYFCLEGDRNALQVANGIVEALGGIPFSIGARFKALYHAAAVLASGHVAALFSSAGDTLEKCGLDGDTALKALLPLLTSTVRNLSEQNPADALTGPFARGDSAAVERHLAAFETSALTTQRKVYLDLGLIALSLAEQKGVDVAKTSELREVIKLALESGR